MDQLQITQNLNRTNTLYQIVEETNLPPLYLIREMSYTCPI